MFTKKQVLVTSTRLSALIGASVGLLKEGLLVTIIFFIVLVLFFFIVPSLLTTMLLKKEERAAEDGELYLWTHDDGVNYRLTINAVNEVPYKKYLKIKVNENAQDESIKKK